MIYYSTKKDEFAGDLLSMPFTELDQGAYPVHESARNVESRLFEATIAEAEEAKIQLYESVIAECSQSNHALENAEESIRDYGKAKEREGRDAALE
jgi:hypothetical protein